MTDQHPWRAGLTALAIAIGYAIVPVIPTVIALLE